MEEDNSYKEYCLNIRRIWTLKHKTRLDLRSKFNSIIHRKYIDSQTLNILGCSIEQFKKHLEMQFKPGMTWDNYGYRGWTIDHIVPCCAFDLNKEDEIRRCFHYTNTQPLWWRENMKKKRIPRRDMVN